MSRKPRVCIDLDGVLAQYDRWRGAQNVGPPHEGAKRFIKRLLDEDYEVVILTARNVLDPVRGWLEDHDLPQVEVTNRKVPALVYLDDRGLRFGGDFEAAYELIREIRNKEQP